jgi:hypothetical protein
VYVISDHADAVIAVLGEVRATNFVQPDERMLFAPVKSPVYAIQFWFRALPEGQEVRTKLGASANTARYLLHPHYPQPVVHPVQCAEFLPDFLKAAQTVGGGMSPEAGQYTPEERLSACAGEVHDYLFFETHIANHCQILSSITSLTSLLRHLRSPSAEGLRIWPPHSEKH